MIREMAEEIMRLRQALWDIYGVLGFDQDGQTEAPMPGRITPDITEVVLSAAKEHRKDYDDLLREGNHS